MPFPRKPDWRQAVRWRRGPLGTLHAEWLDEDEGFAACSPTPLSGPAEAYVETACARCVTMARSVYTSANAVKHGASRTDAQTRLRSLHPTVEVTPEALTTWWPDMTIGAARALLSRELRSGWLERVGIGVYRARRQDNQAET